MCTDHNVAVRCGGHVEAAHIELAHYLIKERCFGVFAGNIMHTGTVRDRSTHSGCNALPGTKQHITSQGVHGDGQGRDSDLYHGDQVSTSKGTAKEWIRTSPASRNNSLRNADY